MRLHVPVDQPVGVGMVQRLAGHQQRLQRLPPREPALQDRTVQIPACHVGQHLEDMAPILPLLLVDRHDPGVAVLIHRAGATLEALPALLASSVLGMQDAHGDQSLADAIIGPPDHGEAAASRLLQELVAPAVQLIARLELHPISQPPLHLQDPRVQPCEVSALRLQLRPLPQQRVPLPERAPSDGVQLTGGVEPRPALRVLLPGPTHPGHLRRPRRALFTRALQQRTHPAHPLRRGDDVEGQEGVGRDLARQVEALAHRGPQQDRLHPQLGRRVELQQQVRQRAPPLHLQPSPRGGP